MRNARVERAVLLPVRTVVGGGREREEHCEVCLTMTVACYGRCLACVGVARTLRMPQSAHDLFVGMESGSEGDDGWAVLAGPLELEHSCIE
jgi:hypothetical protein